MRHFADLPKGPTVRHAMLEEGMLGDSRTESASAALAARLW